MQKRKLRKEDGNKRFLSFMLLPLIFTCFFLIFPFLSSYKLVNA